MRDTYTYKGSEDLEVPSIVQPLVAFDAKHGIIRVEFEAHGPKIEVNVFFASKELCEAYAMPEVKACQVYDTDKGLYYKAYKLEEIVGLL